MSSLPSTKTRLAVFKELMKLAFPELNLDGGPSQTKYTTERNIIRLSKLRNDFMHFQPGGWSIELSDIVDDCLGHHKTYRGAVNNRPQYRANHFMDTDALDLIEAIWPQHLASAPEL